ncbi:MAG: hypothetical protein ABIO32_15385 [Ferruginibacter sp.]
MAIAYVHAQGLMEKLEGIMDFNGLQIIENNTRFRVFNGFFDGGPADLAGRINKELEDEIWEIEDSLFIVYPCKTDQGRPSFSNIIIKRKGNKFLRNKVSK